MSSVSTTWILQLTDKVTGHLKNIDVNVQAVTSHTGNMNRVLTETSAVNLTHIVDSFRALKDRMMEAVQPGIKFQSGLAEVEAITGVTGEALQSLGEKARESSKIFGTGAEESLNNYKIILSKLGPDIAQSEEALESMNRQALTLSKTMDGNTKGAVDALTTAMLQFRVDLSDPIKASEEMSNMMNIMAAGAKYGSAEVTDISAGLKVAGVAASEANVSFAETNAALQELARGGKKGAEGGIALRNILGKMAGMDVIPKEAQEKLKAYGVDMSIVSDKTLPLTDRLRELGKAQGDATLFAQMFGVENQAAASILVRSVDAQDQLKEKITGTNTATEQADIIMNTFAERMKRMKANIEDWGISLFNATENFIPFAEYGFSAVEVLGDLKKASQGVSMIMGSKLGKGLRVVTGGLKKATLASWQFIKPLAIQAIRLTAMAIGATLGGFALIGSYVSGLVAATAAQLGFNIAVSANPIGLIVIGIAAVVGAVIVLIKYWDKIKIAIVKFAQFVWKISPFKFIIDLVEKIFPGFKKKIGEIFDWVKDKIMGFWESIKEVFHKVAAFFGFGDDEETEVKVKVTKSGSGDNFSEQFATAWDGGKKTEIKPKYQPTPQNIVQDKVTPGSSSGGGGGKVLNMTLNVNNIFQSIQGTASDIEDVADKVTERIVTKLRDADIALG